MNPTMTAQLNFDHLPPFQPRRFVPVQADLQDKSTVVSLYSKLLERPVNSALQLEDFLLDRCELDAAVSQKRDVI